MGPPNHSRLPFIRAREWVGLDPSDPARYPRDSGDQAAMKSSTDNVLYTDLSPEQADQIVDALKAYVSDPRQVRLEAALSARTRDVAVVLEDIYSEHNASAVLRTAEAFGLLEVHTVPRRVEFKLSRKVSLGTHKWLDLHRHSDAGAAYAALKARGYQIWAADMHDDPVPLSEIPTERPVALVFGNEHEGLSPEAVAAADGVFKVPMTGFVESLNISVAAAVTMHDVLQRRRAAGHLAGLDPLELRRIRATWYALSVRAAGPLLARAGLPRPFMSLAPVKYYTRRPDGGDVQEVSVEEDAGATL